MYYDRLFQQAIWQEVFNTNLIDFLAHARSNNVTAIARIARCYFHLLDIGKFEVLASSNTWSQVRFAHVDVGGRSLTPIHVCELLVKYKTSHLEFRKRFH